MNAPLDAQARAAVVEYARQTGSRLCDVVNACVTAELPGVLEQLAPGRLEDDAPGILADHVAAAARRRKGKEAPDAPVILSPLPEAEWGAPVAPGKPGGRGEKVTELEPRRLVTVELSAFGGAMLDLVILHDGHSGPEDALLSMIASAGQSLGEFLSHKKQEDFARMLALGGEDEDDAAPGEN